MIVSETGSCNPCQLVLISVDGLRRLLRAMAKVLLLLLLSAVERVPDGFSCNVGSLRVKERQEVSAFLSFNQCEYDTVPTLCNIHMNKQDQTGIFPQQRLRGRTLNWQNAYNISFRNGPTKVD